VIVVSITFQSKEEMTKKVYRRVAEDRQPYEMTLSCGSDHFIPANKKAP